MPAEPPSPTGPHSAPRRLPPAPLPARDPGTGRGSRPAGRAPPAHPARRPRSLTLRGGAGPAGPQDGQCREHHAVQQVSHSQPAAGRRALQPLPHSRAVARSGASRSRLSRRRPRPGAEPRRRSGCAECGGAGGGGARARHGGARSGARRSAAFPRVARLGAARNGAAASSPQPAGRGRVGAGQGRAGLGEGLCRPPALKCESEPKSEPRGKGGGGGWEPPAAARPRSPCTDAEAHTHTLPNANSPLRFCRGGRGRGCPRTGSGSPLP